MPSIIVETNRRRMKQGFPYLTYSQINGKKKYCIECNKAVLDSELKLAVVPVGVFFIKCIYFCLECIPTGIDRGIKELEHSLPKIKKAATFVDGSNILMENDYNHKMFSDTDRNFTSTGGFYSRTEFCSICKKEEPLYVAYVEVIGSYQNKKKTVWCCKHRLEHYEKCLLEFQQVKANLNDLLPEIKVIKTDFPTTGQIYKEGKITISNLLDRKICKQCDSIIERTCVKIFDEDSFVGKLCIKCGLDHHREKIDQHRKALNYLESFLTERCKLCPDDVHVKCVSRGIPINID